jgi:hypothetical protein
MTDPVLVDFDSLVPPALRQIVDTQRSALPAVVAYVDCPPRTLRDRDTPVQTQDGPDCTSFATIAAMENLLGGHLKLSEADLWNNLQRRRENVTSAVSAASGNGWVALQGAPADNGRCSIGASVQIGLDWSLLVGAIDRGHPCVVGMETPRDLLAKKPVVEATSGFTNGGHALAVVGYRVTNGEPYFLVKNSWGVTTGDQGYQWVAFRLFHGIHGAGYAFFIEIASVDDRLKGWDVGEPSRLSVGALLADPVAGLHYRIDKIDAGVVTVVRVLDDHA